MTSELDETMSRFQAFIDAARSLLVEPLFDRLAALRPNLDRLRPWLLDDPAHDLLQIAGVTHVENAYTDLMAWSLHPETHRESAIKRQRGWLSTLAIPEASTIGKAVCPLVRPYTDDGNPDMVLRYERFVVVVEAKTGTLEHTAPSGKLQSYAYPPYGSLVFGVVFGKGGGA